MTSISLHSVSDVNFDDFTTAFNAAYSDYFVPIAMTVQAFRALIARDALDLTASVAAMDGDQIIGTGLLGIRGSAGWIGGLGVIPQRRRQGIGRRMMEYLLAQAQTRGLSCVRLEVIEHNTGAHNLYSQLGFEKKRYLLILDRKPEQPIPPASTSPRYTLKQQPVNKVLIHFDRFHTVRNCWQRELSSLQALGDAAHSWVVLNGSDISGYALGWATEYAVRLVDLAAQPGSDQLDAARALLSYLHHENPKAQGSIYNVAEDDPILPAFTALGYSTVFRQIEMQYAIQGG
ncbi:MAG: GNAT family N-acetyltransferase [Anaerolineae bacterium]|nr:GNAT family N-acetyltransferase [Anaerolineae bacterium]